MAAAERLSPGPSEGAGHLPGGPGAIREGQAEGEQLPQHRAKPAKRGWATGLGLADWMGWVVVGGWVGGRGWGLESLKRRGQAQGMPRRPGARCMPRKQPTGHGGRWGAHRSVSHVPVQLDKL